MKMHELIQEVLGGQEPGVRQVVYDVLVAEQQKIDMEKPQGVMREVEKAIDDQVRREEAST